MVKIRHLSKKFETGEGAVQAISNLDLDVEEGSFFTLLGPSGCGKTTTLRCLAGLESPDNGEIFINGEPVVSTAAKTLIPPHKRDIGMVFQSYAIWPHMSVFENVAFPLTQMKPRLSRQQIREKVLHALEQVRLGGLENRPAPQLSGGQQQRLALARALVKEPKVLLLDEPLSNLDAQLREEMRIELKQLTRRLGITSILVTHDQVEALALSDKIAIMHNGRLVEMGSPKDIYLSPVHKFVAGFIGASNLIAGTIMEGSKQGDAGYEMTGKVQTEQGIFSVTLPEGAAAGDKVLVIGRPETFELLQEMPSSLENVMEGEIREMLFLGDSIDARVLVNNRMLHIKLPPAIQVEIGQKVILRLAPELCRAVAMNEESENQKAEQRGVVPQYDN